MRTGAIISEVEEEIRILNEDKYQRNLQWLLTLEHLIERMGFVKDDSGDMTTKSMDEIRASWLQERAAIRKKSKEYFNPYFGSV